MKCVFVGNIPYTSSAYDQDENGDLVINPHEAKIVRIFYMYLNGSSTQQIADSLTELGCKTKKRIMMSGHPVPYYKSFKMNAIVGMFWRKKHGLQIILTINGQSRPFKKETYFISRDDFIQKLITNAKYGNKEILPELHECL